MCNCIVVSLAYCDIILNTITFISQSFVLLFKSSSVQTTCPSVFQMSCFFTCSLVIMFFFFHFILCLYSCHVCLSAWRTRLYTGQINTVHCEGAQQQAAYLSTCRLSRVIVCTPCDSLTFSACLPILRPCLSVCVCLTVSLSLSHGHSVTVWSDRRPGKVCR